MRPLGWTLVAVGALVAFAGALELAPVANPVALTPWGVLVGIVGIVVLGGARERDYARELERRRRGG